VSRRVIHRHVMPFLTTAQVAGPVLSPYGAPCPHVLSLTIARPTELHHLPEWLDALPNANKLCAAVCLKGMRCDDTRSAETLSKLHMRIHSCVEEPGGHENGHEGVCAFRFVVDNYDQPWKNVFFLHGDVPPQFSGKHHFQYAALLEFLRRDEWPAWPKTRAAMTQTICGCGAAGARANQFGHADFWYQTITWWLGNFVAPRDQDTARAADDWVAAADCDPYTNRCRRSGVGAYMLHNGSLSSPLGFMFNVDRRSVLQRSKTWLLAQHRMCLVGVRALPPGVRGAPRAARLPSPGFDYNPLVWGHVNERLPYFLFGHEYVERAVPPCIWQGDHASMNCSQSEPPVHASQKGVGSRRAELIGRPEAQPARSDGCSAFDTHCGSRG